MVNVAAQTDASFRILLVEDNPAHAELVMRGFEDFPAPVDFKHVADGKAALDYLFQLASEGDTGAAERPHVVLLDLRLPQVDGLEVLRQVKENESLRSIPIVVLTTSDAARDVRQAYEHHANSYVVKPMDFSRIAELAQELGNYWLERNYHLDR